MDDTPASTATTGSWMQPLLFSSLAGMSTCLGAACVFCLQTKDSASKRSSSALSPAHLAFSLAMAGSVMITVSFVSILPESFSVEDPTTGERQWLSWNSPDGRQRMISFGIGCLLYFLLSKLAFPEPDSILGLDEEVALLKEDGEEGGACTNGSHTVDVVADAPSMSRGGSASSSSGSASSSSSSASYDEESASPPTSLMKQRSATLRGRSQQMSPLLPNTQKSTNTVIAMTQVDDKEERRKNTTSSTMASFSSGADLPTLRARRAWRVTMLLFVSLAVHNFPEGLAVAASSMHSSRLGLTTTVAIALHNIPEGIAIAVPCLAARPNAPCLAFWLASLSGLAEPLGAIVALVFLQDVATNNNNSSTAAAEEGAPSWWNMSNVLAFVAGIMTTVATNELVPEARRHSQTSILPLVWGLVFGAVVMIGSEMYLEG